MGGCGIVLVERVLVEPGRVVVWMVVREDYFRSQVKGCDGP